MQIYILVLARWISGMLHNLSVGYFQATLVKEI
jgi:hypothetical protein